MTSRNVRSRVVISRSTVSSKKLNVKLKQTKISDWLGSRSDQNCEKNNSDSENIHQSCSSSSSSDSVREVTPVPPRKGCDGLKEPSNSTASTGEDSSTIVLQLDGILTCDAPKCNYHTSFKENLDRHKKIKHELKRLKCPHCDYVTHSKAAFTRHKSSHNTSPFKCRLCDWTTLLHSSFMQHMKQTHEREERRKQGITRASEFGKTFKCSKCDFRAVGKQEIHLHNYSHETEKKQRCSFPGCEYRSKRVSSLKLHMRRHDGEAKKEFQCPLCSKLFWTRPMLNMHIQSHTKERTVQCTKCKYVTNYHSNMRKHMLTHDKKSVKVTDKQNAGGYLGCLSKEESHQAPNAEDPRPVRDSNGTENASTSKVVKSRSEPVNSDSQTVEKNSRKPPKEHQKSMKITRKSSEKTAPARKKPTKVLEKKHKCDHCEFTAIYRCKIIRHAVVHRDPDDKIYSCSFVGCDFKTNWEDYVKKHCSEVHKSTPDHCCPVDGCGFQTKWKDNLAKHKKIHQKKRKRDHQCPLCRKAFYDSIALKRHINIHTGESKHKCSLCDYVTLEKTNFYAHRRKYHPGQECHPIKVM